ncbi:SulP family sulfate permease [Litorimonas taeanensis]|uniref:SulP family sulfate permease n=1 Tax=Litorimonas taeanensis TaxID=568099 RepID=A0A420WJZ3_9PROT|nr:sulfate permease [Litorimonas taeanensis]RKQ71351.1 SulP family sulfate permease [Litorimonas taeanensis]
MSVKHSFKQHFEWLDGYSTSVLSDDLIASVIVSILLVPQCLAYALLAGLPPQLGIYVSIFPLIAYALLGSSRQLSVGPTAVISLMTAACIATLPEETRLVSAALLAFMTGIMLMIAGLLRGGFLMNFVSRPVVSAYITGAALLIIISQIKHIFGISASGTTALGLVTSFSSNLPNAKPIAMIVGISACVILFLVNRYMAFALVKTGVKAKLAKLISKLTPIAVIFVYIGISSSFGLYKNYDLSIVGMVPGGLPPFAVPTLSFGAMEGLLMSAAVIAIVAFVDSTSTAQEFAARNRTKLDTNRELLGLGASNFVAGMTGGYPINGSMSRTAVNVSAGGRTPMVNIFTALFMALTALYLTPLLKALPLAVLAALIIVACLSLLDFKNIWRTWVYSRADGMTAMATFLSVLMFGVQWGVLIGVILAMALHIRQTLRPHIAEVGRFPGTEHYRDASRFIVETNEQVKTLRIDESLYYANARYLEERVSELISNSPEMRDLVLMCTAVSRIDASALSSLHEINKRLKMLNIDLHFSDMQSRVKERLFRSNLLDELSGEIFLSQHDAMEALRPEPDWSQFSDHIDIH